jgi:Protein of unknown function (DUF4058)
MPLLDHFHAPLLQARPWESLLAYWATAIGERLNLTLLPPGYLADIQVHVGSRIEVDIGTLDREFLSIEGERSEESSSSSSVATLTAPPKVWTPPAADITFPAIFPDVFEILVFKGEAGPTLVGAIELVSPGNKDRPEARRAFVAKCSTYLQAGVGLVVVDIVTNRLANLHDELIDLLELDDRFRMSGAPPIYATAYHPVRRGGQDSVDVWLAPLLVGKPLPTLPPALRGGPCLPLELEATYVELCRLARLA